MPDWDSPPWDNVVLVTPRHGVRNQWNTAAVRRHCRKSGQRMYICQAEDTEGRDDGALGLEEHIIVAGMTTKQTGKIATEADLANGTRGKIVDISLDPREPTDLTIDPETGATMLRYPPAVVLFKPDNCSFPPFEGLDSGVLPIVPSKMGFSIQTGDHTKHLIHRRQLAITPAYAFTDYKSHGQTLEYVLIDLEKPPTHKLTPFSAYVALSRSRGRDRIRLLRGFETSLFTTHPSEDLRREDARLDVLTAETKRSRSLQSA
ncbi:hypothetical protein B0H15DRAFT_867537 [Mycena belliarum]|uniref:Uncharacterized protein n=1 Tax=Mycena belliarum TaxID=1033014 RepID=A0AAD6TP66_9AGAR|nr:hypothetical protein B0H15DRAFT_867537 [Mycena belliae]